MFTDSALKGTFWSMSETYQRSNVLREEAHRREAIWAGMNMLEYFDLYPGLKGFSYNEEWEYDDEGGYFHNSHIYTDCDESVPGQKEAIEERGELSEHDFFWDISWECCRVLFPRQDEILDKELIINRIKELKRGG